MDVLEENLRNMGLDPADFTFYTDGFRYGAPSCRLGPWCSAFVDGFDWCRQC